MAAIKTHAILHSAPATDDSAWPTESAVPVTAKAARSAEVTEEVDGSMIKKDPEDGGGVLVWHGFGHGALGLSQSLRFGMCGA